MGWCSATEIFDSILDSVLEFIPEDKVESVIESIAVPLWDADWDCESDSKYWNSHLVHLMHKRGDIDDDDYRYYQENPFNN